MALRPVMEWLVLAVPALAFVQAGAAGRRAWGEEPPTSPAEVAAAPDAAARFESEIAPLLARCCLECHDAAAKQGGLDLSQRDGVLAGGDSGPAVVPGRPEESLLWQYVSADQMPKDRPPLTGEEKRSLAAWIADGAPWTLDVLDSSMASGRWRGGDSWDRRLTVAEYIETVRSATGVEIESDARRLLPRDVRADGFTNTAYSLSVDLGHVEAYAKLARLIAGRMDVLAFAAEHAGDEPLRQKLCGTAVPQLDDEELRRCILGMGSWLWRGPLDDEELTALMRVAQAVRDEEGDAVEVLRFALEAMLQAPRFVYRLERQRAEGNRRQVPGHELASRLSYIVWGGPPDKELLRAAAAGELTHPEHVEMQVRRMLSDTRAVRRSLQFVHDWLDLDRLATLQPNPQRFPQWNRQLAEDMRLETLAFFEDLVWKQQRPLWELFNAQFTYATPRLAAHYGLNPHQARSSQERGAAELVSLSGAGPSNGPSRRQDKTGLLVQYDFEEGEGEIVHDTSEAGEPLHLRIEDLANVRWENGGLTFLGPTVAVSELPARRLADAIGISGAVTIEAWLTPAAVDQRGPARIVSFSSGVSERNFTLGQEADSFDVRLRTSGTNDNGIPSLSTPPGTVQTRLIHVVYTRDAAGRASLYVDGQPCAFLDVPGDLTNWNGQYRLVLGNETSRDRPWRGTLHRIAIYNRALEVEEIRLGAPMVRYDLTNDPARGGLLTQGSLLTIGGDDASMVARGLFIFNELLYSRVGNPPPCVDSTPVPPREGMSRRAVAETRTSNPACAGCHARFEPLAFGLEKFDGIGARHEVDEHGNRLREDGLFPLPDRSEPIAYETIGQLMDLLASSERVRMGITRKLTQFALGRPLVARDERMVRQIHHQAMAEGGTYAATMKAILLSELVLTRAEEAQ